MIRLGILLGVQLIARPALGVTTAGLPGIDDAMQPTELGWGVHSSTATTSTIAAMEDEMTKHYAPDESSPTKTEPSCTFLGVVGEDHGNPQCALLSLSLPHSLPPSLTPSRFPLSLSVSLSLCLLG